MIPKLFQNFHSEFEKGKKKFSSLRKRKFSETRELKKKGQTTYGKIKATS